MISDSTINEMIETFQGDIKDLKYDYELSDVPGFREPVDKRYDRKMIEVAEEVIRALKKYKETKKVA